MIFSTIDNNICQYDITFIVTLNYDIGTIQNAEMVVTIVDNDASACNDPHKAQNVLGRDENDNQFIGKLCYDLYGQASDRILGSILIHSTYFYI